MSEAIKPHRSIDELFTPERLAAYEAAAEEHEQQERARQVAECAAAHATRRRILDTPEGRGEIGIPLQYRHLNLCDLAEASRRAVTVFIEGGGSVLTFFGPRGSGKTAAALVLAVEICRREGIEFWAAWNRGERKPPFIFDLSVALVGRLREKSLSDGASAEREITALCRTRRTLIIDDLAAVRPTPFSVEALERIILEREFAGLPTVTTIDVGFDELAKFSDRITSRLAGAVVVPVPGADRRVQRADG